MNTANNSNDQNLPKLNKLPVFDNAEKTNLPIDETKVKLNPRPLRTKNSEEANSGTNTPEVIPGKRGNLSGSVAKGTSNSEKRQTSRIKTTPQAKTSNISEDTELRKKDTPVKSDRSEKTSSKNQRNVNALINSGNRSDSMAVASMNTTGMNLGKNSTNSKGQGNSSAPFVSKPTGSKRSTLSSKISAAELNYSNQKIKNEKKKLISNLQKLLKEQKLQLQSLFVAEAAGQSKSLKNKTSTMPATLQSESAKKQVVVSFLKQYPILAKDNVISAGSNKFNQNQQINKVVLRFSSFSTKLQRQGNTALNLKKSSAPFAKLKAGQKLRLLVSASAGNLGFGQVAGIKTASSKIQETSFKPMNDSIYQVKIDKVLNNGISIGSILPSANSTQSRGADGATPSVPVEFHNKKIVIRRKTIISQGTAVPSTLISLKKGDISSVTINRLTEKYAIASLVPNESATASIGQKTAEEGSLRKVGLAANQESTNVNSFIQSSTRGTSFDASTPRKEIGSKYTLPIFSSKTPKIHSNLTKHYTLYKIAEHSKNSLKKEHSLLFINSGQNSVNFDYQRIQLTKSTPIIASSGGQNIQSFYLGNIIKSFSFNDRFNQKLRVRYNLEQMLKSGLHFGEKAVKCNANMRKYLWTRAVGSSSDFRKTNNGRPPGVTGMGSSSAGLNGLLGQAKLNGRAFPGLGGVPITDGLRNSNFSAKLSDGSLNGDGSKALGRDNWPVDLYSSMPSSQPFLKNAHGSIQSSAGTEMNSGNSLINDKMAQIDQQIYKMISLESLRLSEEKNGYRPLNLAGDVLANNTGSLPTEVLPRIADTLNLSSSQRPLIKKGRHILNLFKTRNCLMKVLLQLTKYAAKGNKFLFVGTKKSAAGLIARAALFSKNAFFVNTRWLGGMLTNWKTILKSISQIRPILQEKQKLMTNILTKRQRIKTQLVSKLDKIRTKIKLVAKKGALLIKKLKTEGLGQKRFDTYKKIVQLRTLTSSKTQNLLKLRQNLIEKRKQLLTLRSSVQLKAQQALETYYSLMQQHKNQLKQLKELKFLLLISNEIIKFHNNSLICVSNNGIRNVSSISAGVGISQMIPTPPKELKKLIINKLVQIEKTLNSMDSSGRVGLSSSKKNSNSFVLSIGSGKKSSRILIAFGLFGKIAGLSILETETSIKALETKLQSLISSITNFNKNLNHINSLNQQLLSELLLIKGVLKKDIIIQKIILQKIKRLGLQQRFLVSIPKLRHLATPKNKLNDAIKLILDKCIDPIIKEISNKGKGTSGNSEDVKGELKAFDIYDDKLRNKSKKEAASLKKKWQRLEKYFGGVAKMKKNKTKLIAILIGQKQEKTAVLECQKVGIKTIQLIDSNCNPSLADYFVPMNDDSRNSIKYILTRFLKHIRLGQKLRKKLVRTLRPLNN